MNWTTSKPFVFSIGSSLCAFFGLKLSEWLFQNQKTAFMATFLTVKKRTHIEIVLCLSSSFGELFVLMCIRRLCYQTTPVFFFFFFYLEWNNKLIIKVNNSALFSQFNRRLAFIQFFFALDEWIYFLSDIDILCYCEFSYGFRKAGKDFHETPPKIRNRLIF